MSTAATSVTGRPASSGSSADGSTEDDVADSGAPPVRPEPDSTPADPAVADPAADPSPTVKPAPDEPVPVDEPQPSGFSSSISEIDDALAARMQPSWRDGCPVPLAELRYLTLAYRGFDGAGHQGEMVVAATVAEAVVSVFHQLYDDGYPIESMRLVDDFGASDEESMDANNTSAFNCRAVTGGSSFSEHSYGTAIDLNPVQNPYLRGSTVLPSAGAEYSSRPAAAGVIHAGDAVVSAFESIGWSWGGYWSSPTDYQHFSQSGR